MRSVSGYGQYLDHVLGRLRITESSLVLGLVSLEGMSGMKVVSNTD